VKYFLENAVRAKFEEDLLGARNSLAWGRPFLGSGFYADAQALL
jgi:hypothetical protein